MARTVLDLDDELLAEAAEILGTSKKVATVNAALADLVIAAAAERNQATVLHYNGDYDLVHATHPGSFSLRMHRGRV